MVDASISGILMRLGFADVILWLLTFAVVYGVLSQVDIPKNKEVRAIIAIVMGFFVLMAAPSKLITVISSMSGALVTLLLGLFVLLVLLEVGGVEYIGKKKEKVQTEKGEVEIEIPWKKKFTQMHPISLAIFLIIMTVVIFVSAGGLNLIGFKLPYGFDVTGAAFFILILLAIIWMITEKKK